jgi:hypothetical protein
MPGELRMIKIPGMNGKHVGMNRDGRVLHVDEYLDSATRLPRRKRKQRMIVEPQMLEDLLKRIRFRHLFIVLRGRL